MGELREYREYSSFSAKWLYVAFVVIIIAFGGIWLISQSGTTSGAATNDANVKTERYLIKPVNAANGAAAKAELSANVQHEFSDGSFTIDASPNSQGALKKYGEVKPITQLRIPQPKASSAGRQACAPTVQMPWNVAKIGGGSGGAGITVAILDTGVAKHDDIQTGVCMDTTKRRIKSGCADQNGHGTHVAGIIAANGGASGSGIFGVAPNANIFAIKTCKSDGTCWADDIAEGIYYAVDNGANIIVMSFGADSDDGMINSAIAYGVQHGVMFVAAAGNDGPADNTINWPAANVNVIAVGAIDSTDAIAEWSSRGINYQTTPWAVEERDVEFAAPGVSIESTWNNGCYQVLSGTSMAAPHVAGLAAKLWQGSASATRTYLQYIARYYHTDIGRTGDDPDAGFGLPTATSV